MMKCPYCGSEHQDGASFCPVYGKRLTKEENLHCPNCGGKLQVEAKFCPHCRFQLFVSNYSNIPISGISQTHADQRNRNDKLIFWGSIAAASFFVLISIWVLFNLLPNLLAANSDQEAVVQGTETRAVLPSESLPASPTVGFTADPTVEPSLTPKFFPTNTLLALPTNTRRPLRTPTEVVRRCPGSELQRVKVGDKAKVCTKSDRVIVREKPELNGSEIFRIYPRTEIAIVDGPECADNSSWWKVRVAAGTVVFGNRVDYILQDDFEGWVREGSDKVDLYFICPVPK